MGDERAGQAPERACLKSTEARNRPRGQRVRRISVSRLLCVSVSADPCGRAQRHYTPAPLRDAIEFNASAISWSFALPSTRTRQISGMADSPRRAPEIAHAIDAIVSVSPPTVIA